VAPLAHKITRLKGALHSLSSVGCRPSEAVLNVGAVYGLDLIKSIARNGCGHRLNHLYNPLLLGGGAAITRIWPDQRPDKTISMVEMIHAAISIHSLSLANLGPVP